jgi:acyl dehydratase
MPDYYEDVTVGETAESPCGRTISEVDLYTQAGLSGSYNPLHTDAEYMKGTEYGRPIVQNTLLIAITEGLHRRLGWDFVTVAAYGRENMRFTAPVFVDDTVHLTAEISDKREKRDDAGVVTITHELYNQDDDLVLVGDYLVLVEYRDPA